jgi:hypothetical protein
MKYHIAHISDILAVPPEHLDECMRDIRACIVSMHVIRAAAANIGKELAAPGAMLSHIDFIPDGKGEITPMHNGKEIFTVTTAQLEALDKQCAPDYNTNMNLIPNYPVPFVGQIPAGTRTETMNMGFRVPVEILSSVEKAGEYLYHVQYLGERQCLDFGANCFINKGDTFHTRRINMERAQKWIEMGA